MPCSSLNLWPCGQCEYLKVYEPERDNYMCKGKECPAYISPMDELLSAQETLNLMWVFVNRPEWMEGENAS